MSSDEAPLSDEQLSTQVFSTQLAHFRNIAPPCTGMQLPDGVLLRHTQSDTLYFYLRTVIENGKFRTQVFASDSPYDRQKTSIGVIASPMFSAEAEENHLFRVEQIIRSWVEFVKEEVSQDQAFQSFPIDPQPPR